MYSNIHLYIMWLKGTSHQNKQGFKQGFKQIFKQCTVTVCENLTTKQLEFVGHVTCWNFPGNFRETVWETTTVRAADQTHLLTMLLRLLSFGFSGLAWWAGVIGCPAHNTTHTSDEQETSWKLPGSVQEGLAGALQGTRIGAHAEGQGGCTGSRKACCQGTQVLKYDTIRYRYVFAVFQYLLNRQVFTRICSILVLTQSPSILPSEGHLQSWMDNTFSFVLTAARIGDLGSY